MVFDQDQREKRDKRSPHSPKIHPYVLMQIWFPKSGDIIII